MQDKLACGNPWSWPEQAEPLASCSFQCVHSMLVLWMFEASRFDERPTVASCARLSLTFNQSFTPNLESWSIM